MTEDDLSFLPLRVTRVGVGGNSACCLWGKRARKSGLNGILTDAWCRPAKCPQAANGCRGAEPLSRKAV